MPEGEKELELYPSNWLYNAGVIGFLRVLERGMKNKKEDKGKKDEEEKEEKFEKKLVKFFKN
ncbi:MAG: hypothetical protein J7L62_07310, partial [Candidatus Aminicenantes bacterium]|nr:hypothetical protein [Candidatus Aminicenantes bacterium]